MNWNNGTPGLTTDINLNSEPNIVIDDSVVAVCKVARISVVNPADANLPSIFMTGGKLNVSSDFVLGQNAGSKPVMEISGGIANIYSCWTGNMDNSGMGSSRLCITGGTLTCNYLWVSRFSPSTGQPDAIQLDGGTISTGQFNMGQGYMDITAGTLIINGDVTSQIDTYISNGWLTAYNGTGVFIVDYNNLNLGKTTVKACASGFETDFNGDCLVDITDLSMMVSDWLFKTPSDISWAFDMSTDPVGSGTYDLKLRDTTNIHYNMTDWPGTLAVSGDLLLDEQVPSSGLWDADLQYVVKSVTEAPLNLWVTMGTSANPGKKAYVGVSTKLDSGTNTQTVEIWTGNPPHVTPYSPVVATGFASNAFIAITVNYDYATDTYDWSASDGVLNQSGTNVAYSYFNDGNGGSFTIQGTGGAMGYIDALSFTIAGSDWYSVYDLQPDGSVDLIDFAVMASEWLN
jgi:hypothetical protein